MIVLLSAGCFGKPASSTPPEEPRSAARSVVPEVHAAPAPAETTWTALALVTPSAPEPARPAEVAAEELWHSHETLGRAWSTRYPAGQPVRITGIIAQPLVTHSPSGEHEYRVSFYTFIANPDDERLPATLEHLGKLPPRFKSAAHVHCVFDRPDDLVGLNGLDPATIEGRLVGYREQPVAGLVFRDCKVIRRPLK
jgi:hypothetical protein